MKLLLSPLLGLSLSAVSFFWISDRSSLAQVTSDGTVNTQVTQNGSIAEINGGQTSGSNLFHSFGDFSVPTGNEAFFNNADSISNIFSRVTGGNISNIDGAIRANGSANLFLINPAGIIFGENARLDIGGSFYGSSASSILFEDGEFSAVENLQQPVLTVNAPIGLGFREDAGDIINRSTVNNGRGLEVDRGSSISLLGGNVNFDRGIVTAPAGTINLGGLSGTGTINFEPNNIVRFPDNVERANVSLLNSSIANVSLNGGGLITVNARNLELNDESLILANIGEDLGSDGAVAGAIELNTTNLIADGSSLIQADNLGTGRAGTININTNALNFTNGSAITASTFGAGDAGVINVTAQDITIDREFSGIYSNVGLTNIASESLELDIEGVVGNGGEINVNTNNLFLFNGARIISSSIAQGDGGAVNINATGAVRYRGLGETPVPAFGGGVVISGSFSQVQQEGVGNAGEVNITADSLTLLDVGAVLTDNSGTGGNAGNITLDIANEVLLDRGALILAQVQEGAVGNGGDIIINAASLDMRGDSFILADTKGQGNAGNIDLNIDGTVTLVDDPETENITAILAEVGENGVGNAGNINIEANALILEDGADIAAQTKGQGDAGNIIITTNEEISLLNNSEIRSLVENNATGNGGDVLLTTAELNLTNSSNIIADTTGISPNEGDISTAGDIVIDVSGDINLNNSNQIQSQTRGGAVGNAGNITINAGGSLFSRDGNLILADSQATGNGGSIDLEVGGQILLEGLSEGGFPSQIVAGLATKDAVGTGGSIEITASEIMLDDLAFISSNTVGGSQGIAGSVTIDADSLNLANNSFINVFTSNNFDAGSIEIDTQNLNLESGGKILAATAGGGNAGNVRLNISDRITINNSIESAADFVDFGEGSQLLNDLQSQPSGIYADATPGSTGNGGDVNIGTIPKQAPQEFVISNGGQIVVDSEGLGIGGNIFLTSQSLELDNGTISASTQASQDDPTANQSGSITLQIAEALTINNNSLISAEAFNDANGGNLTINSRFIIASSSIGDGNDIVASAEQGIGGNIDINSTLLGIGEDNAEENNASNDIDASSEFSLDGNITINTPDNNIIQGTIELPNNVVEPEETTAQACQANRETVAKNSLTFIGRGGIAASPDKPLDSQNIVGGTSNTSSIPAPIKTSQGKIQPARGIEVSKSGDVMLTAYRTNNSGERLAEGKVNCGA